MRDQNAEQQAAERTDQTRHGALAEKKPPNLGPGGSKSAQNPNLGPPLRHGDRKRVVDDEHPDEECEEARDVHHHRVGREHRLELSPATRGRFHLKPRAKQCLQLVFALADGAARLHREIDAIELAAAPEHPLRGVDVHDREVAAERAGESGRLHDPADGEPLFAFDRAQRNLAERCEPVLFREVPRENDGVGLCQKDERIVDDGLVAAVEIVIAQTAIAGHVDSKDQQAALARNLRVDDGFYDGNGDADR